jgi:hypothetical protein
MDAHEAHETHEHAEHAAHGHGNRRIAVLISVLAAMLAIVDLGAKGAQNAQMTGNIHVSDTWAFFQAKTIRITTLRTIASAVETLAPDELPADKAEKFKKQIAEWRATAERYESEPSTQEGRKELMAKAKTLEAERDHALAAYHNFELGAAALQIAIVLASAGAITGIASLAFLSGGVGLLGLGLGLLGWFSPDLLHHMHLI